MTWVHPYLSRERGLLQGSYKEGLSRTHHACVLPVVALAGFGRGDDSC